MRGIYIYNNASCLICDSCNPEMRRVGAVILCVKCCDETFSTDDPVRK